MNRDTIVPHVVRVPLFMSICRVTPSRVCELKYYVSARKMEAILVTPSRVCELKYHFAIYKRKIMVVTPSRVCELKYKVSDVGLQEKVSHPHGCVS